MALSSPMTVAVSVLRAIRMSLGLSQAEFASALNVALETLRTWDANRRPAPEAILVRARALQVPHDRRTRVPLHVLAAEFDVHVRTLRAAARDGRLAATFEPRTFFGALTATATREATARFVATSYRRTYGRGRRPLVEVCRIAIPPNYASVLVGLRCRLGLSQQQLADKVGAASKAVVYQWESGKRRPSPVFWLRVSGLQRQRRLPASHPDG